MFRPRPNKRIQRSARSEFRIFLSAPFARPLMRTVRCPPAWRAISKSAKDKAMSQNKQTVKKYIDAFSKTDHKEILSCLTDDVEWVVPGVFHLAGKEAFDKEIENDAFVGSPTITLTRMTEEQDVVVAEGTVRSARRDGGVLNAVFCDVFVLRDAKITHVTSYLMEVKA